MSALRKPSEITESGWYWAEERTTEDSNDYQLAVLHVQTSVWGDLLFESDGEAIYDAAMSDHWFRIIRRIEEPEVRGGWA